MSDPSLLHYVLLAGAGFAGGLIDAVAGGGGLITIPALLAAGLPPQVGLATNKLQSSCGTAIAAAHYLHAGWMKTRWLWLAATLAFLSSMAGARAVAAVNQDLLKQMIPWMLAVVAVYTALNRRFGLHAGQENIPPLVFAFIFGPALGFYDGFFGPGTGSFWTVAAVSLLGLDLREATGYTKAANLASNLGALSIFLAAGSVHWGAGGVMIAGQLAGARVGSALALRKGAPLIRPVFLAVVFAVTLKLLWDAFR